MIAVVTGSGGLVGSETVRFLLAKGFQVIGIDNDMRARFFGPEASTKSVTESLRNFENFISTSADIRDFEAVRNVFRFYKDISIVVHTAAQPSHDWAAKEPLTDFGVNAVGTINLLEATRLYFPKATFIFTSTSKVYGDTPNRVQFHDDGMRFIPVQSSSIGINEFMSIDQTLHSVFGASKVAADVMVQEYGKYFGMNTVAFRGGCLTGKNHKGAMLHGFLSYLCKCAVTGDPYTIYGYNGKQVRCNIDASDLVEAFWQYHESPRPGEVYNIGGGLENSCSILEAISIIKELGYTVNYKMEDVPRVGDHKWWVSDTTKFKSHYPKWEVRKDLRTIIREILESHDAKHME